MSYRPRVCLDSSVLVKWFKIEEESTEALELRKWVEEMSIILKRASNRTLKRRTYGS
jgi:hypothetical protein